MSLILMVLSTVANSNVILMTLACQTAILLMLLIVALAVPVDFTKWTALFLLVFLIIFVFALAVIAIEMTLQWPRVDIVYSFIAVVVLSIAMLLNIQVLLNGAIFELYPDDFVLGAILMFADIM